MERERWGSRLLFIFAAVGSAAGWLYKTRDLQEYINSTTEAKLSNWWIICIKFIAPVFLIYLFINQLIIDIKTPYEGYPYWAQLIGGGVFIVPLIISLRIGSSLKLNKG